MVHENNFGSLDKFKIELGLDNMKYIMELLGNPQNNYKIIHIAGTNGKGSTASFIESGLIESNYKTGKYTSPEIFYFNERISINKIEISNENVDEYYKKVNKILEENNFNLTYFELTTAMMFLYMSDKKIDYLVLETGLGGRLDATNIVTPILSLITNISYDHTEFLGESLQEIAYEKAGIIKDNIPVLFSDNNKILEEEIKKKTSNYINVLKKYDFNEQDVILDMKNIFTKYKINNQKFELSLYGKFQVKNFLLAYETLKYIGISDEIIKKSSKKVVWYGRFQVIQKDPYIILDGAHNRDSAKVLSENIQSLFSKDEVLFIISILKDKDINGILEELAQAANTAIFTGINNERGLDSKSMFLAGKQFFNKSIEISDIKEIINKGKSLNKKAIIICGSFYLLKEFSAEKVMELWKGM